MRRKPIHPETHLALDGIVGFYIRTVKPFGNSAKVDCPREHLGKRVYLVITDENPPTDD